MTSGRIPDGDPERGLGADGAAEVERQATGLGLHPLAQPVGEVSAHKGTLRSQHLRVRAPGTHRGDGRPCIHGLDSEGRQRPICDARQAASGQEVGRIDLGRVEPGRPERGQGLLRHGHQALADPTEVLVIDPSRRRVRPPEAQGIRARVRVGGGDED